MLFVKVVNMKNKAVLVYYITNHRIVIQLYYDFSSHLSLRSLAVNFVLVTDSEVSMVTIYPQNNERDP